jgi:hypothetical protein
MATNSVIVLRRYSFNHEHIDLQIESLERSRNLLKYLYYALPIIVEFEWDAKNQATHLAPGFTAT